MSTQTFHFQIDGAEIKLAEVAGINSQIEQNYQGFQALQGYARDPMGWSGDPRNERISAI